MTTKTATCRQCSKIFDRVRHVAFYCSKACAIEGRLDKTGDCWLWTGAKNDMGYGQINFEGTRNYVHRVAFESAHGPATGGVVCHRCDTPLCCNPDHLFLGTQADNMHDMRAKGRHFTKLTEDQVRQIRGLRGKITRKAMTRQFGISLGGLSDVLYGKTWKHLL